MQGATIWRDLRWRLLAALLLALLPAAVVASAFSVQPHRLGPDAPPLGYAEFLDAVWFWLPGPGTIFLLAAVLLGAAGALLRPRADLAFVLALPVSRRRLLLGHLLASLGALAVAVIAAHLLLAVGAWRAGEPLALLPLLGRMLGLWAAAAVWVSVTIGVVSVVRHPLLAATVVLGALVLVPGGGFRLDLPVRALHPGMLPPWDPWAFADPRAWSGGVPLASLLVAAGLGVAGVLVAYCRVERFEP